MNRYKFLTGIFILLALIVVVGSIYLLISYSTEVFNAIVEFITTNDLTKLSQCGAKLPPQFSTIKSDLTTVILPAIYYGVPLLLLLVSVLMFLAGFYYHKGCTREEEKRKEEIEKEIVRKAAKRVAKEKAQEEELEEEAEPG